MIGFSISPARRIGSWWLYCVVKGAQLGESSINSAMWLFFEPYLLIVKSPSLKYCKIYLGENLHHLKIFWAFKDDYLVADCGERVVFRKSNKSSHIRTQYEQLDRRLSFIGIQDMTKPWAFDGSMEGINRVIHVASPFVINDKNSRTEIIDPAICTTKNRLTVARNTPSLKRIIFTGPFASILNLILGMKRHYSYSECN